MMRGRVDYAVQNVVTEGYTNWFTRESADRMKIYFSTAIDQLYIPNYLNIIHHLLLKFRVFVSYH